MRKLLASDYMDDTNETIRQQFSDRLKKELARAGLPVSSPTQVTNEFNRLYPAHKMTAQTMRKWLFAEAIPTQARLLALADMLCVSPHWLRFGMGARKASKASGMSHDDAAIPAGGVAVSQQQAG